MAETYCAIIGETKAIELLASKLNCARVFCYSSGFNLVPYTSAVHIELCEKYGDNPPGGGIEGTESLNGAIETIIRQASGVGKIAYIFEEHFGGRRDCDSVVWHEGVVIYGPTTEYENQKVALEKLGLGEKDFHQFRKYDSPDEWCE